MACPFPGHDPDRGVCAEGHLPKRDMSQAKRNRKNKSVRPARTVFVLALALALGLLSPLSAQAYVRPWAGLTVLSFFLGVTVFVVLPVFLFLTSPVRQA